MLCPSISYVETYKDEILIFLKSVPKHSIVCAHFKFQWQNLLSIAADHEIPVCSNVFVFAKQAGE